MQLINVSMFCLRLQIFMKNSTVLSSDVHC